MKSASQPGAVESPPTSFLTLTSLRLAHLFFLITLLVGPALTAAGPVISNIRTSQRPGTGLVDISYDVASPGNQLTISIAVSTNSGAAYDVPATSLTGSLARASLPEAINRSSGTRRRTCRRFISPMSASRSRRMIRGRPPAWS